MHFHEARASKKVRLWTFPDAFMARLPRTCQRRASVLALPIYPWLDAMQETYNFLSEVSARNDRGGLCNSKPTLGRRKAKNEGSEGKD